MTTTQPLTPFPPQSEASGPRRVNTVVVGGGQAGLATAYCLNRAGIDCVVLEARERVGDQWRERYDSLRLFSPALADGLPGHAYPGRRSAYPSGREMGDFLESYVRVVGAPVRTGVRVLSVDAAGDAAGGGGFTVATDDGGYLAENVVIASGSDVVPRIPEASRELDPGIRQLHSSQYRNPDQLLPGGVLVVGASQSGADLALEAAQAGRDTWLSGRHHGEIPVPHQLAGPFFWVAQQYILTLKTPLGRRIRPAVRAGRSPLVRTKRSHLDAAGVRRTQARTVGARDGLPLLDDGTVLDVANVLWCTGFRPEYSWIRPLRVGADGWPAETEGVADGVPGLFFVGLVFQRGFYSHLIGGVGRDAKFVAGRIAERARAAARV